MNTSKQKVYGFQIDDNSFFFRDIAKKGYRSLFDCFYLALLRDLHRRYGTLFTLNCYFRTEDGFTLEQFPDRYRAEWAGQADWLRLTFHADADQPDLPYQNDIAGDAVARDCDRIRKEIVRFAGEPSWAPPAIVHWAALPQSAWPVLIARGTTCLAGLFDPRYPAALKFNLPPRQQEYVLTQGPLLDPKTGLALYDVSIICNLVPPDKVDAALDAWVKRCPNARVLALWSHEQYFWDFYGNYLPDHPQRVERAIRWVAERGIKPVFLHDLPWREYAGALP